MPVKSKTTENAKFDPAMRIGFRDMVALFNVSTRTLQIVLDGGYVQKGKDGLYKLCDAVQGYARYKSDHGTKKGATKEASSQRVQEARARQIEQAMAIQSKELISFSEHVAIVDMLVGGMSAVMDGMPAQLTRDRELRTTYEKKFHDAKQQLTDRWAKMLKGIEESAEDGEDGASSDEEEA